MEKVSGLYKKLYHYTTWNGLLGILKTQTLWATHYRFLNDYSELVLIRDKLIEAVSPVVEEEYRRLIEESEDVKTIIDNSGGLERVVQHDTASFVDAAYKATGENIYIVSFCGEDKNPYVNRNGLLSQWRGYGGGGGIALAFETRKLEEILQIEAERYFYGPGHISNVIYSDDKAKFEKELRNSLNAVTSYFKEMILHRELNLQEVPDATRAFPSFVQCISRYKHRGFKEENEVRVVCLPTTAKQNERHPKIDKKDGSILRTRKDRKFRKANGNLIPYIDLFDSSDIVLPIQNIIVGPHKEKESRASVLGVMLRHKNIEITVSDIPFIGS